MQKGQEHALAHTTPWGHSSSTHKAALAKGEMLLRLPAHLLPGLQPPCTGAAFPAARISPDREQQLTRVTSVQSCFSERAWAAASQQNENYPVDWQDEPKKVIASLHQGSPLDTEVGRRSVAANRVGGGHGLPSGHRHDQQRLERKRGAVRADPVETFTGLTCSQA